MAIGIAAEERYYDALEDVNDANTVMAAIEDRNRARDNFLRGDLGYALMNASLSVTEAEGAVEYNPAFERELFASLGRVAQIELSLGYEDFARSRVDKMEKIDPGLWFDGESLDQYQIIFWATRAAVRYSGSPKERAMGSRIAFTGLFVSALAESKHFVNFPNRDQNSAWRVKKKVQFIGRNIAALGANIFRSRRLAKIAVE